MATIGIPDALEIEGPTASKQKKSHTVAPKFARQSRLIVHPNSAPRHILTRAINHVVTVAPDVDLAQIHDDTATYLRSRQWPTNSRLVLNFHDQNLPDPEFDEWQEFKKDVQVLADGHGVTICVKSNQPSEEGGLEIQPYALEQETLRRPAMAAMPSLGLIQSLRHELRLEQKLQQSIQLSLQDPYSGMCAIYAQAQKKTYNKHGMQFEYACVKRSEVPLIVAMGSAGMRWGDMIFVVEDFFPDSGTRPGFREQFNELVAVHEFGERLWSNHHQASMLEFAIAQKEGILEEYLDFLKGRYLLKFRDVVYERMLPELREKLGLKEDETLPADISDVDDDDTHRIAAEHWRDGFNWPENLYKTYATELNEYDLSDKEVNKSETWAEAVRTQAFVEQYLEDAGKEFAKSFKMAFKKSSDVAASINTAAAIFYRKLDGLLTDIDEHEEEFNKDFLNDEVLASVVTRAHENLEASLLRIVRETYPLTRDQEIHRRAVTASPFIKQTWSEHAAVLNAQRGYLSYLRDERKIDEITGNEASAALKKLWADAVIPGLTSKQYLSPLAAIEDQYVQQARNKALTKQFGEISLDGKREFIEILRGLRDYPLAIAYLERYVYYRIAEMCQNDPLWHVTAADVQPLVDKMLDELAEEINLDQTTSPISPLQYLRNLLDESGKLDLIDVSKMSVGGKNLADYNTPENDLDSWLLKTLLDRARHALRFHEQDPLNSDKYTTEDAVIILSELFVSYWGQIKLFFYQIGKKSPEIQTMQQRLSDWLEEKLLGHPEHAALVHGRFAKLFDLKFYWELAFIYDVNVVRLYANLADLHLGRNGLTAPKRPYVFINCGIPWLENVARAAQSDLQDAERRATQLQAEAAKREPAVLPPEIPQEELEIEIDKLGTLSTAEKRRLLQAVKNGEHEHWKGALFSHYSKIIDTIYSESGKKTAHTKFHKKSREINLEIAAELIPLIYKFGQGQNMFYIGMPKDAVEYLLRTDATNATILRDGWPYVPMRLPHSVGERIMNSFGRRRGNAQNFFDQDPIISADIVATRQWASSVDKILWAFLKVDEANRGANYFKYVEKLALMAVLAAKDRGHKFTNWDEIQAYLNEKYPDIPRLKYW